ncbi:hypothetical protein PFLU3_02880 [Pseudomonas fluorescens]|uniref:Uncharacterized protein n=1 Tax=Pseudomonas fluorescens TaxID=294 RepID=A0A0D0TMW5_PSEFL|nr:hypothetical protein PFLU3_02880 [Pseudomonas fluorescens]
MGGGLLPMAVDQVQIFNLAHRYREQAPSHSFDRISNQPNSHFQSSTKTTTASTGRAMR